MISEREDVRLVVVLPVRVMAVTLVAVAIEEKVARLPLSVTTRVEILKEVERIVDVAALSVVSRNIELVLIIVV